MLKIRQWNAALIAALVFVTSAPAFAVIKQARPGDVATSYRLEGGLLSRLVRGNWCDITTNVADFKVSDHPNDRAMIYFIRNENTPNLYVLNNNDSVRNDRCPRAIDREIASDIKRVGSSWRYSVVPRTRNTTIVNVALTRSGDLTAWDNIRPVVQVRNVVNYTMHRNYGVTNAPFSSYVLFALNDNGQVAKVRGRYTMVGGRVTWVEWEQERTFNSLEQFQNFRNIRR